MRPMRFCGAKPGASILVNDPGAPSSERYSRWAADCTVPFGFCAAPPRQPTAARTAPPLVDPEPPGACTTTSETMLARLQAADRLPLPAQGPTGRSTF